MNGLRTLSAASTPARLGLLGSLYFAQGLPFGFFTQALPVLMRKHGHSLGQIGLSSLLALPWALKFLWAPAVDRYWDPRLGRRRSWILPLQVAGTAILIVLALSGGAHSLPTVMVAILLLNLVAATQDIGTDGLAIDILAERERGIANGLQVAGYRVGMIVGGGVLLVLYDHLGPSATFLAMAFLTALSTIPIAIHREPPLQVPGTRPSGALLRFLRRKGSLRLLAIVVAYKAGDAFATGMIRPFLADQGLGLAQIGWLVGTVGFAAGLAGAMVGGALVARQSRRSALLRFGFLQAAAVGGYAYVALGNPGPAVLWVLCGFEHFAGGMATAALFTCMMDWCSAETSATDYTLQASAVVIATGLASTVAGVSAERLGYFAHFSVATGLALAALLVVHRNFPADGLQRLTPTEAETCV